MKPRSLFTLRQTTRATAAGFLLASSALPATAAEFLWSASATTNSLSLAGNWVGGVVPATGTNPTTSQNTDILVFNNAAQAGSLSWGGNRNMGGIEFRGAAVGSYTIATGAATPRAIMTLGGKISMDAAVLNPQTLVRLGFSGSTGNYTIENLATSTNATLTVSSSIVNYTTGAMNLILTGSNTGDNTLSNNISENAGAGALAVVKNGDGTWILQGTNTYTGTTTLSAGVLGIRSSSALGAGDLILNGGRMSAIVSERTLASNIQIGGNIELGGGAGTFGGSSLILNGTVDLKGGVREITTSNPTTMGGVISNGGLTKLGPYTLTLGAANTYTGTTTVSGGRLSIGTTGTINSTSGVSIDAGEFNYNNSTTALSQGVSFTGTGGTLSGTGTITPAVVITSGNRQTAGTSVTTANPTATLGKETFSTSIDFQAGSIFEWNLTANNDTVLGARGTNYDAVDTASLLNTGADAIFRVVLNGTENFDENFWNADRTWADIFKNGDTALNIESIFGTSVQYYNSAGLVANGNTTGRSFTISGSDLKWSAVPEPTGALAGLLLTTGLLRRRRHA